jgi:hypothetical protein
MDTFFIVMKDTLKSKIKKFKEDLSSRFLYDVLKLLAVPLLALLHKRLIPYIPQLGKISTLHLSILLVIVIILFIVVRSILGWGKNIFKIRKHSKIFFFNPSASSEDQTKNKDFLLEQCMKANDINILGATGFQTFARKDSTGKAMLRDVIEKKIVGEIKILLLNPNSAQTKMRANALGVPLHEYQREIINSVQFLEELKSKGKNIALKFYTQRPIWKMIILDDFLWLQYYHPTTHVESTPVYGVSRSRILGEYSLFDPLYAVFQKKWRHDDNPTYDFTNKELVYPDGKKESLRSIESS